MNPAAGRRRLAERIRFDAMGGYEGASQTSSALKSWFTSASSPDTDIGLGLKEMRARTRDLARNNPLAGGAIHTIATRVVGSGLSVRPQPMARLLNWTDEKAAEWSQQVMEEFGLFADSTHCDLARKETFYSLQEVVFRGALDSGDSFTVLAGRETPGWPYRLALQVLEADRVGNPAGQMDAEGRFDGVEFDPATGEVRRYHVYDQHPGSLHIGSKPRYAGQWRDARTARGTPALLHHYRQLRPGQTRGIPHLAPVIKLIKQAGRYTDAEVAAAVLSAFHAIFIESPFPEGYIPEPGSLGEKRGASYDSFKDALFEEGGVIALEPGDVVKDHQPGRPNTAFDPFMLALVRQIGVALELPFEVLVKHFTASYSAARAALLDAWVFFKGRRVWLARTFCQPVYEAWLEEAVASGLISAPGIFRDQRLRAAYCAAVWTGDSAGTLNPRDEVGAMVDAIDANLITRERAEMELFGSDFSSTLPQKIRERVQLKRGGLLGADPARAVAPGAPQAPKGGGGPAQDPDRPDKADEPEKADETEEAA